MFSLKVYLLSLIFLFGLLSFDFVFGAPKQRDPCTLAANYQGIRWIGTTTDLANCFNSIPFNVTRASLTLIVLRQLVTLYSFTDIAKNSGPPWNIQVDLEAGLNAIEANFSRYTGDYSFHEDLVRLFMSLNDAHTLYQSPKPYSDCVLVSPFNLYAVNNGGQVQVLLQQGTIDSATFASFSGFDPSPYIGQVLTQINGQPAITWLQNYANRYVGSYKDPTIRTMNLFQYQGAVATVPLGFVPFNEFVRPDNNTIGTSTVSVPKLVVCLPNSDTDSWIAAIDTPLPIGGRKRNVPRPWNSLPQPDIHRERHEHLEQILGPLKTSERHFRSTNLESVSAFFRRSVANTQAIQLSLAIGNTSRLQIKGKTQSDDSAWYGVYTDSRGYTYSFLKLTSFSPANLNELTYLINDWYTDYRTNGYTRVIVDVSKNGGGLICLSLFLQAILVQDWVTGQVRGNTSQQVWEPYDLRKSNITDGLLSAGYYLLDNIRYLDGSPVTDNSWYTPGVTRTRGGVVGGFSQQFIYPYACSAAFNSSSTDYFPVDIMIITEGTCGSACSLFVTKFQKYRRAVVVSHGGLPGVDMDSSSFAGGNVLDWNKFIYILSSLPDFPNKPIQMPTSAFTRFNQFEMYMGLDATTPREWNKFPTDYHLLWWDAVYNDNIDSAFGAQAVATLYESAVTGVWNTPPPPAPPFVSPTPSVPTPTPVPTRPTSLGNMSMPIFLFTITLVVLVCSFYLK